MLPGLATPQTVVSAERVRAGDGLRGVVCTDRSERGTELGEQWVDDATEVLIWPDDHPDVELELRAESGARYRDRSRLALIPTREVAYGLAFVGCIVGLLVVQRAVSTMVAGGGAAEPGRIERIMMSSTPTTFAAPPAPVLPSSPTAVPPSRDGMEPIVVALGEREVAVQHAASAVHAGELAATGQHSHSSTGQLEPGGREHGPAAERSAFRCERPDAEPKPNIDVVFVIDVSTTMTFMLRHLSEEIASLDAVVRRHDAEPRYGLAVFVDDVVLVNGGRPYADVDALRRDFEHWAAFTSTNRQLGSELLNLDWPENSLDALHAAATGFDWRPAEDTVRLIVHATDDTFGDGGYWLSGGQVRHGYAQTVEALREAHVRVATFAARIGGRCACENVEAGFFAPYRGQPSIPDATGGAVFDIDEVASRRLRFADAVTGLVGNAVCD